MAQQATQADDRHASDRFITDREVAHLLGASRSGVWKLAQAGRLPAPVRLTSKFTRWRLSSIQAWMADPQAWQAAQAREASQ